MEGADVARAVTAAMSAASASGLVADDAIVLHNSNKLSLRLLPCDVVARVAWPGQERFAFEVDLALRLGAASSPIAALESRVKPRVVERDGFALTFWKYYESIRGDAVAPVDYAHALRHLHEGMRTLEIATPHFTDRVAEAQQLVASRHHSPALTDEDRVLLREALEHARQEIGDRGADEQVLHGEPHAGNVLGTHDGALFIDWETCCRGPIEFDLAHAPEAVSEQYAGADQELVRECRKLVLAMVAAWRWDRDDEFPDGLRAGQQILQLLRDGPPWPVLGDLRSSS